MGRQDDGATVGSLGEEGLIDIFSAEGGPAGRHLLVANGDDAAAWSFEPRHASITTTDSLVEGVHFDLAYTPARAVGRKLVSVNLSDVAAMGGQPRYLLLSVCIPPGCPVSTVRQLASGVQDACRRHGVAVIGGNTASSPGPMVLTATAIGCAPGDELVSRRGSRVGDAIFVTGWLGDARAGLQVVECDGPPASGSRFSPLFGTLIDPQPRLEAGRALARSRLVHAMCDISDGFGRDVRRLLVPEGLGARVDAARLPLSPALRAFASQFGRSAEWEALAGGEDYELVFTARPEDEAALGAVCASSATPVHRVGSVTGGPRIEVRARDGSVEPLPMGYQHYRGTGG